MGIRITATKGGEVPYPITLALACDQPGGLLCRGAQLFDDPGGFIGAHAAAMKQGWLERQTNSGRLWLCPECSGK